MPTDHIVTSYKFSELTDKAKEKARDWFREEAPADGWWASTYEDAARVFFTITGFDLGRGCYVSGKFEREMAEVAQAILKEHGKDCRTYALAEAYLDGEQTDEQTDEFARDLRAAYWSILNTEAYYLLSDESVDESIEANEYNFTADGRRFTF